ncbi:MAG: NAD+ synthase [Candidatus Rokubacteria bacterium RIFCSPLOWO2_02_FULL_68_19]|nr:MAG: NAD+ synthase [Candidatus Rokubacteria bacterium RIFCSPLOWO2_02_FULL_68_19]
MKRLRIGLAQVNPTVGDLEGNVRLILDWMERARTLGCDVVAFPELALTGYPPEDLLFKPAFIEANLRALDEVAKASRHLTAIVGFVDKRDDIFNAAAVLHDGRRAGVYHKQYLPNYGVFDENRYFQAGTDAPVFALGETLIAANICEDIWYPTGPTTAQALAGAELVITINGSPYYVGKGHFREKMLATRAADDLVCLAFVNMIGGQDELVFDGQSFVFNEKGECIARGKTFEEDLIVADLDLDAVFRARLHDSRRRKEKLRAPERVPRIELHPLAATPKPPLAAREVERIEPVEEIYKALVVGTRDYVRKNGFRRIVVGLSGGIDSSLVAALACEALGAENVAGVTMPSPYSSKGTRGDAKRLGKNLGIEFLTLPITAVFKAFKGALARPFKGLKEDVTEENIQARIRGTLLMALSNKFGWLVLTTGNKSEIGVGYCTLYGDMAGGFAVIKDVPKTMVYKLARHVNERAGRVVIPESVFERPPSAELRPDQTDQDTLPPYPVLDAILEAYVEGDKSLKEIAALGFDTATVRKVVGMVDKNEYKRRQGPIGIKITPRAFGKDWRLPIVNRFREP